MTDETPYDPVLAHIEPVPGGLYGDQPYEAALSDLRSTVAAISAAASDATGTEADRLREHRRELNRLQHDLRPDDADALKSARERCAAIRRELAGGAA
ncbi:hypothetical protein [Streptomyces sp. NPDC003688]